MNRFHVHVSVDDLDANVAFYTAMFGAPPSVVRSDYAKWMIDDPRVNFAISARGAAPGLDHLGIQVENDDHLADLKARYDAADATAVTTETSTVCCYARSNKHWITDPQGIAWEAFHTLDAVPTFPTTDDAACCAPGAELDETCCGTRTTSTADAKLAALPVRSSDCCAGNQC